MDHPIHAADTVDKDETVPKIIAAIAGLALLAIAAGAMMYSGLWSPAPTTVVTTTTPHK
jgi:hypothetical protein